MIRTSTRTRAILALAAAGLAVPASAMAVPTTPDFAAPLPAFVNSTSPGVLWPNATFDANNPGVYTVINKRQELSVRDLTTGAPAVVHTVNFPNIPVVDLALSNGHQYALKLRARNDLDFVAPAFPTITLTSPWGPEQLMRVDATDPTGTFDIAGGTQFVNSLDVSLNLDATDPLSAGFTPSGVTRYRVSNTDNFACGAPCAFKVFIPAAAHQLVDGPDGPRTVKAQFADAARTSLGFGTGNLSATLTDTVLLDRLAPTPNHVALPAQVVQGTPVQFDASTSVDGANGPNDSGVDPASYQWSFGDGTFGSGVSQSHTYGALGTYNGTLTIKDRAGNSAVKAFSIKVNAPAAAVTPAGQNTGNPGVTPAGFSLGKIQLIGKARQFRTVRIRVAASAAAGLRGKLTRTVKGRTTVVRRFSKAGGPGAVVMSFKAPKLGIYRLEVSAGDLSRSRSLRVVR
jgi:PKD domain